MQPPQPTVLTFDGHQPDIAADAFIAPGATLLGRLHVAQQAGIWYSAVLRGDLDTISIGPRSNVQDGCTIHADPGYPVTVGNEVTVGHRAVLHGCTIAEGCLIGMGAIVLNGAVIGAGSLVAAGTVVLENTEIPPGSLVTGTPGKVRRELTTDERTGLHTSAQHYVELAAAHRTALHQQT